MPRPLPSCARSIRPGMSAITKLLRLWVTTPRLGVSVARVDLGEWLSPAGAPDDAALLYLHGGAWFQGSARSYRAYVSSLARRAGMCALAVDYRLAPEHPFPAGLEDWPMASRRNRYVCVSTSVGR